MKISGFTIVRNAVLLGYPFRQSVLSILPLCHEVIINCGDCSDSTLEICQALALEYPGKVKVFETQWKTQDQSGGTQLKYQTDQALARCGGDWCLYIQADEILHESGYGDLIQNIHKADKLPSVDGLLFDYRHFYVTYNWEVRGRQWYRKEVRAFKNNRHVESFRDAQGFRKDGEKLRVLPAGAEIYHYGYVRNLVEMKAKAGEMSKWWGAVPTLSDQENSPKRHVGLSKFTGKHPAVMADTIAQHVDSFNPKIHPRAWNISELKSLLALLWERVFSFRIGEYKNYEILNPQELKKV